uniref:Uncharacterized protein n=1 Tax=Panagrolaimus sp. ES5 TaxID=591445 RepID=A0AC34F0B3_9BILA
MKMGRQFIILSSIFILLTTFPCFIEADSYNCTSFKTCTPLDHWNFRFASTGNKGSRTCEDACATFFCIENGAVIYGGGCYSDFKTICTSSTLRMNIEKIFREGGRQHIKGSGSFLQACKTPNCEISIKDNTDIYEGDFLQNEFRNGFTSNPNGCTGGKAPDSAGLMNQMNRFQLLGMTLLGFLFAQFW